MKDGAGTKRRGSKEEAAFIDLIRTTDILSRRLEQVMKAADLSSTQYNVLRILRGSPEGLSCGEIGSRMITRDPDITRLLDRLEKRALIVRARDGKDRRTVVGKITTNGLELLATLDEPVQQAHRDQLGHQFLRLFLHPKPVKNKCPYFPPCGHYSVHGRN